MDTWPDVSARAKQKRKVWQPLACCGEETPKLQQIMAQPVAVNQTSTRQPATYRLAIRHTHNTLHHKIVCTKAEYYRCNIYAE